MCFTEDSTRKAGTAAGLRAEMHGKPSYREETWLSSSLKTEETKA
jgi:hypothetical protein